MAKLQMPKYANYFHTGQICVRQRCEMCRVSITLLYIYGNQLKGGSFTNREDPDAKLKSHTTEKTQMQN